MPPKPMHFLLVEDDAAHAALVRMALEENRVANTMDRVSDGEQALQYPRREGAYAGRPRPDVVLPDLELPKVDGHEILQVVKEDQQLRTLPVVVLTMSAAEVDRVRAYSSHANSFVVKPLDFRQFHEMIRTLGLHGTVWNEPSFARR